MTRQRHAAQYGVNKAQKGSNPSRLRQQQNRQGRVAQQNPYHETHDRTGRIGSIQPNAMFVRCSDTARPWHVIEIIKIVFFIVIVDFGTTNLHTRSTAFRGVLLFNVIIERQRRPESSSSKGF